MIILFTTASCNAAYPPLMRKRCFPCGPRHVPARRFHWPFKTECPNANQGKQAQKTSPGGPSQPGNGCADDHLPVRKIASKQASMLYRLLP